MKVLKPSFSEIYLPGLECNIKNSRKVHKKMPHPSVTDRVAVLKKLVKAQINSTISVVKVYQVATSKGPKRADSIELRKAVL